MRVVIVRFLGPIERFAVDRVHCSPDLKKSARVMEGKELNADDLSHASHWKVSV